MDLHIVAGPNGAGKTTFAQEFLPNYADCRNFVNADLIARGIAPFSPETAAIRAGRMMLTEIQSFAQKRVSFAFETTLSGRSYLGLLRRLKAQGYKIHFYFLWVENPELAESRVRERVARGGHSIPSAVIYRRFSRSLRNFISEYRGLADSWILFNNSSTVPSVIATGKGKAVDILNRKVYQALIERFGSK